MTTTTIREVLRAGVQSLARAGVPDARRDARILMAAALNVDPGRITLAELDPCDQPTANAFDAMIVRRMGREPVARILGRRVFFGRDFLVTPFVLDPRPETECLIELALKEPFETFLDIGTGSGCIALTLLAERPSSNCIATDISPAALETAQKNANVLQLQERVHFEQSDWFASIGGEFDLIVSNPPYIHPDEILDLAPEVEQFDPKIALFDADDGLTSYRRLASGAGQHLRGEGRILVEIGPTQAPDVKALFEGAGLVDVNVFPDLDGRDRVVSARKSSTN